MAAGDHGQSGGRKRKRFETARLQHGSRAKKRDLGRGEWSRQRKDKRQQNEEDNERRARANEAAAATGEEAQQDGAAKPALFPAFSQDEIQAEERRPKHKVAVMIGYSGTGYKGMQINTTERTIEGDLFNAFIAAGAISKANANDPKKSSLARCARTDKGVHAAGNVISLKLIVEDKDVVEKINAHLPEQIRVWGIQRTTGSFSCYQACDSRWYEYVMPSHVLLPPHPSTWLSRRLSELAEEAHDTDGYKERQSEVASFWEDAEAKHIKPVLDSIDDDIKAPVLKALYDLDSNKDAPIDEAAESVADSSKNAEAIKSEAEMSTDTKPVQEELSKEEWQARKQMLAERRRKIDAAAKSLRAAYLRAKREYRVPEARLDRLADALTYYLGTHRFHNYTISKKPSDPSVKRHIKSFHLNREPIIINGTEWLSLKIHGQSFMMHQIRKMIGMITLAVRCGCPLSRITETFQEDSFSIPKVPGLGLLLERPVFDNYNQGAATKFEREKIDFSRYDTEMLGFKQRNIYERIYGEEESGHAFHTFYTQVDNFQEPYFLYLSSGGLDAVRAAQEKDSKGDSALARATGVDSDDEEPGVKGEEDS